MRRLTVVQLLPPLQSVGVERSTLEIPEALLRAGHRAILVPAVRCLPPPLPAPGPEHVELDIGRKSPFALRHVRTLRALFAGERMLIFVEDVGRHNAIDTIAGWMWLQGAATQRGPTVRQ